MEITYYADDCSMGNTSSTDCDKFREWAEKELEKEYPEYEITVTDEENLQTSWTDNLEDEEGINDFCSRLWDNCPWNWS